MYSKIINPKTGRKVSINGRLGKFILRNYLNVLYGGRYKIEEAEIDSKVKIDELGTVVVKNKHEGIYETTVQIEKEDSEKEWISGETQVDDAAEDSGTEERIKKEQQEYMEEQKRKDYKQQVRDQREEGWERHEDDQGVYYFNLRSGEEVNEWDIPKFKRFYQ